MSLPNDGKLGGSGSGQPASASPSVSQTSGLHAKGKLSPKNKTTGFDKGSATGSLINDLRMGRAFGYMHNPMRAKGHEDEVDKPSHLPSQKRVEEGDDDHAIAGKHMDRAKGAKTTDEKRSHVFNALSSLNRAKRRGY